jgi:hypothetical protein
MIKNIMIAALSLGILFLVVFANLKANEAKKQRQLAQEHEKAAIEAAAEARRQEVMAQNLMQEVQIEASEYKELLNASDLGQKVLELKEEVARQHLISQEQEQVAIEASAEARRQEAEAIKMQELAEASREEAEKQRALAEENHIRAVRLSEKAKEQIEKLKKELEACQSQ